MLLAALSIACCSIGATAAVDDAALIALARAAVTTQVHSAPAPVPKTKTTPAPVFVTIERHGRVLGCRGSLDIRTQSLEQEVLLAARNAAAHDPRYPPLRSKDLESFLVTVTIVERVLPIRDVVGLQPEDGLVLESEGKKGVVLPWEGKDPQVRLGWAYRKAGVPRGSAVSLYRLTARRFRG